MIEQDMVNSLEKMLTYPDKKLFGDDPREKFRLLAKTYHPDRWTSSPLHAKVSELFTKLSNRLANFGNDLGFVSDGRNTYKLQEQLATGDFSNVYLTSDDVYIVKISHGPQFNKFLKNEKDMINLVRDTSSDDLKDKMSLYVPKFINEFSIKDGGLKTVTIYSNIDGYRYECVPMTRVREIYPNGISVADAAWIIRRLLQTLHVTKNAKIVHGAITPSHVLLGDHGHQAILIGWTHAVLNSGIITTADPAFLSMLPPEIKNKKQSTYATDLYMVMECFKWLCKEDLAKPEFYKIRGLITACQIEKEGRLEVNKAYELLTNHLSDVFGPPKYRFLKLKE